MRHLRWKRKYFSGLASLDRPKQRLYQDLQVLQTEMEHNEHCQDMEDLMTDLNHQARRLFEAKAGTGKQVENILNEHTGAVQQTLEQHLPLAALDTPACRDCAVCAHTDVMLHGWLDQARPAHDQSEDDAA